MFFFDAGITKLLQRQQFLFSTQTLKKNERRYHVFPYRFSEINKISRNR